MPKTDETLYYTNSLINSIRPMAADGAPILGSPEQYERWQSVCSRVFADLQAKVNEGDKTLIDEYGATNPAEFFSVVTETFFENRTTSKRNAPNSTNFLPTTTKSTRSLGLKKLHPPTERLAGENLSVALLVLFLTQRPEVCEPPDVLREIQTLRPC